MRDDPANRLVVFSDDWGRHPSSCQHLIRHLLPRSEALWVNTIGTRAPRLTIEDMGKAWAKLREWMSGPRTLDPQIQGVPGGSGGSSGGGSGGTHLPDGLSVINPLMWPGFRRSWQRRFNANRVSGAVNAFLGGLGSRRSGEKRIAVTTLPVTCDLVGRIKVDRWVYYCVDDFSVWPGLDGDVLERLERLLVQRVDHVVTVSQTLRDRIEGFGRSSELLTHGIDLDHWSVQPDTQRETEPPGAENRTKPTRLFGRDVTGPIILFWGLIDQRLDTEWCKALFDSLDGDGVFVLVGPTQSPDPVLRSMGLWMPGPVPYEDLPAVAAKVDVLVMPYADLPVTRAMQPLKFKEYLATGKPVVVRDLPATRPWADAADVVDDPNEFIERVRLRVREGIPSDQVEARKRLKSESWEHKARRFEAMLLGRETS